MGSVEPSAGIRDALLRDVLPWVDPGAGTDDRGAQLRSVGHHAHHHGIVHDDIIADARPGEQHGSRHLGPGADFDVTGHDAA